MRCILDNVTFVPNLKLNLLSVVVMDQSATLRSKHTKCFDNGLCQIKKDEWIIAEEKMRTGLFIIGTTCT